MKKNSYQNKKRKRNLVKKLKLKYKLRVLKALARRKYWDSLTPEEKREHLFPSLPSKDFLDFISEFPEVKVAKEKQYEWNLNNGFNVGQFNFIKDKLKGSL